ncbi:MAG: DUF357 domain-containing protein [Archaeoglobaceae archaeon]|nr:DUF357 domain-containing protein [Archaeoglobales archaeon]MDI9642537.1 DUF357 domain-containing protein [Archaeoglobales archaeon]
MKVRITQLEGDKRFLDNIKAYASDAEFFLLRADLVRAFECVIWAWAWLEIGLELKKIYEIGSTHAGEQSDHREDR